jgi:hypothetical protein
MSNQEDLFDKLCKENLLNRSSILSQLDEFTVYCYYIEGKLGPINIQVGDNLKSPLRDDDTNPSLRLYYGNTDKLYFTDYGNKNKKGKVLTGDVVTFVQNLFNLNQKEALRKISVDFGLREGIESSIIPLKRKIIKPKKELGIKIKNYTQEELAFWATFHITPITLERYNVFSVDWILWDGIPMRPKQMAFAYRIGNYWKLYTPNDENHKFVTYYPNYYVEGLMQLRYQTDLLIITKSTKDVMVLAELDYEAISPLSESTKISDKILLQLEAKYSNIFTFFDNDGKHNAELYPYPAIELPLFTEKDISDFARTYGLLEARSILKQILKL